jgi:hypothetical protein
LTDPEALRQMVQDEILVRVMTNYSGIFHPKVLWLSGARRNAIWIGSNNLTGDGLLQNIEFSTLIKSDQENPDLLRWHEAVHAASEALNKKQLAHYESERRAFAVRRAATGTYTWSLRREPQPPLGTQGRTPNLTVKKIPKHVLSCCEWGHDDYSLNVENLPKAPKKRGQQTLFAEEGGS